MGGVRVEVPVLSRPAFCIDEFFASKSFAKKFRCKNVRETIFVTSMLKSELCDLKSEPCDLKSEPYDLKSEPYDFASYPCV